MPKDDCTIEPSVFESRASSTEPAFPKSSGATSRTRISDRSASTALVQNYLQIRRSIGVLGMLMPLIMGPGGLLVFNIPIQENMSSYYHTVLRDMFVGIMCSIGIFFYCYRGQSRVESWTANLTCAAAFGIALMPIDAGADPMEQSSWLGVGHSISGAVFFTMMAFFPLYIFPTGQVGWNIFNRKFQRHVAYYSCGLTILGTASIMGLHLFILRGWARELFDRMHAIFWLEWITVWAFGISWLIKGRAILRDL